MYAPSLPACRCGMHLFTNRVVCCLYCTYIPYRTQERLVVVEQRYLRVTYPDTSNNCPKKKNTWSPLPLPSTCLNTKAKHKCDIQVRYLPKYLRIFGVSRLYLPSGREDHTMAEICSVHVYITGREYVGFLSLAGVYIQFAFRLLHRHIYIPLSLLLHRQGYATYGEDVGYVCTLHTLGTYPVTANLSKFFFFSNCFLLSCRPSPSGLHPEMFRPLTRSLRQQTICTQCLRRIQLQQSRRLATAVVGPERLGSSELPSSFQPVTHTTGAILQDEKTLRDML